MMKETLNELDAVKKQMVALTAKKKSLEADLLSKYQEAITLALADKDYNCGTVTIEDGDCAIKVVVPKKVVWDQDKLKAIMDKIKSAGQDPAEYVDMDFSVRETRFKSWPSHISEAFMNARTVTPGAFRIEYEVSDGN